MSAVELVTKVEAAIAAGYAAIDQSKLIYPVAIPKVERGDMWGRLTVEVHIHWQLQSSILAALSEAGLEPKITDYGRVIWYT